MKTISTHLSVNNNEINQLITTKNLHKKYDQAAGDININATISQVEQERNKCEEELYRLRYGIENLLANNEQGDFKIQQQQKQQRRSINVQNPFRTMTNSKNKSWIDRCSPCCRRWRRQKHNNNIHMSNEYPYRRDDTSSIRSQPNSFISNSPSRSLSSRNRNRKKNFLKRSIQNLMNLFKSNKSNISNLISPNNINDPIYNSLILKILEAKALDCLCTGYSKQRTQKQIKEALAEINQSLISSPANYGSSSVSSILTNDKSPSSNFITPKQSRDSKISSPSSDILTPNTNKTTSTLISPRNSKHKTKSSLKLNSNVKSPRKKSNVTIRTNKTSKSKKSKIKRKPSSKHRSKIKTMSKQRRKSTSTTKKRSKSKTSNKRQSSLKKNPSKSSSKHQNRKKSKSKTSGNIRRKRTKSKPKSNNHITDHQLVTLPTFIYPQTYQDMYRNQQKSLKLFLLST